MAAKVRDMTYDQRQLAMDAPGVRVRVWQADHEPRYKIDAEIPLGGPSDGELANITLWKY